MVVWERKSGMWKAGVGKSFLSLREAHESIGGGGGHSKGREERIGV